MIEIPSTEPHVFKTEHGKITVCIIDGRLYVSCDENNLAVIPRSGNSLNIHVVRPSHSHHLYEPITK